MQVFVSWSGEQSRRIAYALHGWLPDVLQFVEPWMSSADITAGQRWSMEVGKVLEVCKFGIICVTPENVAAPWLLFEAGALSKSVSDGAVIPLLFHVNVGDINNGPLGQFQAKKLDKAGVFDILVALNACGGKPVEEQRLRRIFEQWWPALARELDAIPTKERAPETHRSTDEILEDVVIGISRIERRLADPRIDPVAPRVPDALPLQLVPLLRESAARAVQDRSLRTVARDIGMSPMGLRHFLEGASPYSNTLKKIAHWYLRFVYLEAPKRVSGWDLVGTEADEDAPHEPQSLDETEEEEGETDEQ